MSVLGGKAEIAAVSQNAYDPKRTLSIGAVERLRTNTSSHIRHKQRLLTLINKRKYVAPLASSPEHPGVGVMLQNLSYQVRKCLRRAEDCARKAASQSDPTVREYYQDSETGWLKLARSYELTDQLTAFSQRESGTFYSIHVRRKTGAWDTELQIRQGKLPIAGDEVVAIIHGETLKARVIVMTTNGSEAKKDSAVEIIDAEEV